MAIRSRIILPRLIEQATLYASSAAATLPPANAANDDRTEVWRSTGCTSEYLDVDLGETCPINCAVLLNHTMTAKGTIGVQAGASQGDNSIKDDTYDAWEPLFGYGEGGFGEHGYGGYLTDDEIATYFSAGAIRIIYFDQVWARWLHFPLADPDNPAGVLEVGRIIPATYLESGRGVAPGMGQKAEDPSPVRHTIGGQPKKTAKTKYRSPSYSFNTVQDSEVWGLWFAALQELGTGVSFVLDALYGADLDSARLQNQLYCHIDEGEMPEIFVDRRYRGDVTLKVRETT